MRAQQKMANIDFKNLKQVKASTVAQEKTIYSDYVAVGEPEMLDPTEVASITIARNKFDKSSQPVQQPLMTGRRNSIMAQVQMMFQMNQDDQPKDDHLRELQLAVTFNDASGFPGITYFGLADDMKVHIDNGTLYEGMELSVEQVALQKFVHREFKPIKLAYVDVASIAKA